MNIWCFNGSVRLKHVAKHLGEFLGRFWDPKITSSQDQNKGLETQGERKGMHSRSSPMIQGFN